MLEKKKDRKTEPLLILSKTEIQLIEQLRKLPEKKRKALCIFIVGE
jgi:hypothetical protein